MLCMNVCMCVCMHKGLNSYSKNQLLLDLRFKFVCTTMVLSQFVLKHITIVMCMDYRSVHVCGCLQLLSLPQ